MERDGAEFDSMAYGPIGKAVRASMAHSEADPIGTLAALLAQVSTAFTGHVRLLFDEPLGVWTLAVGLPAEGRKGTAVRTALALLPPKVRAFIGDRTVSGVANGPAFLDKLLEVKEEADTTKDSRGPGMLVFESEYTNITMSSCRKLQPFLHDAWDGARISNTTKGGPQSISRPRVGFHAHIQPGIWGAAIKPLAAQQGSYSRVLPVWVHSERLLPTPKKGAPDWLASVKPCAALDAAFEWLLKEPRLIGFDEGARVEYDALRQRWMRQNRTRSRDLSAFFTRADAHVRRIAAVYAIVARKTEITRPMLQAARAFVEYSMSTVEWLESQATRKNRRGIVIPIDDRIVSALGRLGGQATRTQLFAALGGMVPRAEIDPALDLLIEIGRIEPFAIPREAGARGPAPRAYQIVERALEEPEPVKQAKKARPARTARPAKKAPAARKRTQSAPAQPEESAPKRRPRPAKTAKTAAPSPNLALFPEE